MNATNAVTTSTQDTVFLSVVIYRSYRSIPLLNETFLMLLGQTCLDFEVVVIGTSTKTPDDDAVRSLIDSFSPVLNEKIRLVPSTGKTRAEALNCALDHVHGHMVSFIDEGDLPFDNWVECLQKTVRDKQCILYAYAIEQVWEFNSTKDEGCVLRSVGKVDSSSCHPFNIADFIVKPEFRGTSFAFPLGKSGKESLRFDETLCTLDRWDYLLRSLNAYPLATFDQPASLTRIWRRPADPNIHSTIWDKTLPLADDADIPEELYRNEYDRVIKRLTTSIPQMGMLYNPHAPRLKEADLLSRQAFAQQCSLTCHPIDGQDAFTVSPDIGQKTAWTLRFTMEIPTIPLDGIDFTLEDMRGCITLSNFICAIKDTRGDEHRFDLTSCEHNGLQIDCNHAVFLVDRPMLTLRFATPIAPTCVHLKLEGRLGVEDEHVNQFTRGKVALWSGRIKRWALRRINRL